MKRIWKYEVPVTDRPSLQLSLGAKLLHFGVDQYGDVTLWILIDDEQAVEERNFRIYGTGRPIPEEDLQSLGYIGTAMTPAGLVWHLFEVHS